MTVILGKIATSFLVIMVFYIYYIMVLSFDMVATKTDDALLPINLLTYSLPFVLGLSFIYCLKEILFLPLIKALCYKTSLRSMRNLRNHKLRNNFKTSHFKVGWFGMIRMFKIQGYYNIPLNAGTIFDSNPEYQLNPIFISYLKTFRGYKKSSDDNYLIKKIKK